MKTKVIFRKFRDGGIIAIFPEIRWDFNTLASYMHIGQHGPASPDIVNSTKPATPSEYSELKNELEKIGYCLEIRKKLNYNIFRV